MKVLIYPRAHGNPYHELLYGELRKDFPGNTFSYLEATPGTIAGFPFVAAWKRLQGYRVFHLHWHAFYLDKKYRVPFSWQLSFINTVCSLVTLKLLGYKLVWTAHDALPHETNTSNDAFITKLTARLASGIIVHSKRTIDELRGMGIDVSKAVVIPHGNYDGSYPTTLTRAEARERLHIKKHEKVILCFGNIRPYKGIDTELLPAFAELANMDARLVIAGKSLDAEIGKRVAKYAAAYANVTLIDQRIPDEDVSMYFDAADVVCLPFTSITTSGSVILAATYGKPLVTPRLGEIKDMPASIGILYDPSKKDALLEALRSILKSPASLRVMGRASRAYASTLSWDRIAEKTFALYTAAED